ncbi:hypothetical protein D515_03488 [Grimontia indica]|uniref:Integrin alpha beta-propellor repeat protein n=1 Tax=Grimontia indica TaxID=1056512 RepID=R1GP08_9GAMM|nr:FG-GAP repeat protein [Grimontia indica]EOD77819.1 hypothetical protein D515_03488 [Grimontia indica]
MLQTILIRPRCTLASSLFMLLRVGVLLTVFMLTGCPDLVLWQERSKPKDEASSSTLSAFNIISVSPANSSSPTAYIGRVEFEWEAAGENNESPISYSICQKDPSESQGCLELASVTNAQRLKVDIGGALSAVQSDYFIRASRGGLQKDSNEISIVNTVANQLIGYIKASNAESLDEYGSSIALSEDGNTLAVGAANESSNATGVNGDEADNSSASSGAVYVYRRQGGVWSKQAYIKPSILDSGDYFGKSVSLSADGNTLSVTAPGEDSSTNSVNSDASDNSGDGNGAAYVFRYSAGAWSQQAYIKPSNSGSRDAFGNSGQLSGDGNTFAVCARNEDSNAMGIDGDGSNNLASNSGAVYVFRFDGSHWAQDAYIKASNTEENDTFCFGLAISGDGNTIASGAWSEDSDTTGIDGDQSNNDAVNAGAVYVFRYDLALGWQQESYIKASNTGNGDRFGNLVDLNQDGTVLVATSFYEDSDGSGVNGDQSNNAASNSGAAYVFRYSAGSWTQEAFIKMENADSFDRFGESVALSGDGGTLVIASAGDDSNAIGIDGEQTDNSNTNTGSAAVYRYDNSVWTFSHYLKGTTSDDEDNFGASIALSEDGSRIAISADLESSSALDINGDPTDNSATNSGAVYLF